MSSIEEDLIVGLTQRETNVRTPYVDLELVKGDITKLEVDAIVNAAHDDLTGGGGVDGAIHKAAGQKLLGECLNLYGCPEGESRITGAYDIPAKYVIHTVGPVWANGSHSDTKIDVLKNCYYSCLRLADFQGLKSIAFPCISTGAYCFPKDIAARSAIDAICAFFNEHSNTYIDIVNLVCFDDDNFEEYKNIL